MPLRRSITFWSGILVILFITGAWWDSMRNVSALAGSHYAACSEGGLLVLFRHPAPYSLVEATRG